MASALRIIDLNGRAINVIKGDGQSWAEVVSRANLPNRFDFCIRHWMSDDPLDAQTEERIKAYLDRVGYILIQDKPDARIITDYKDIRDKVALIPVAGIPQLENLFYGKADDEFGRFVPERTSSDQMSKTEKKVYDALTLPRRVSKTITRLAEKRKRLDAMHKIHPDARVTFETVDTENVFVNDGVRWKIDDIAQYRGKPVKDDILYDMDKVVCVRSGDEIFFYDQDFNSITGHVHRA